MGRKQMQFHKITVVLSDKKLNELAHFLKMEQYTASYLPDSIPAQDLAMTVCQGIKHELDLVVLKHDEEVHKILDIERKKEEK